jgi:uncharacterized protein (TIGR02611 family)
MQKFAVTVLGGIILIAGVIMLVTPGPGLVTIAVGLAVLGSEYHWARRLLARVRGRIRRLRNRDEEQS